jgi:hypothetical protein
MDIRSVKSLLNADHVIWHWQTTRLRRRPLRPLILKLLIHPIPNPYLLPTLSSLPSLPPSL